MRESDTLTLADGRILSFAIYGSPVPHKSVFYFHSFPSSRKEGKMFHSAAAKLGVRLVVPDRPGVGNSSFQPNRTLLDWPKDVIALADHLKIESFYVMGLSGGGPYTLACVNSVSKERLAGAAVISGLYPVSLGTAGMTPGLRLAVWAGPWASGLVGTVTDMMMGNAARNSDPKGFEDAFMKDMEGRPEADKRALKDEKNWESFVEGVREGLRQGGQGSGWEYKLGGSPWGFELRDLKVGIAGVPLTLWHGTDDFNCTTEMASKAKDLMPGAMLHMKDGEGHVSHALNNQEEILGELIGTLEA